jgi:DNA polymerase III delta subunit
MQTFSSLHGRKKQSPGIKTIEVFIPTYQLEWERLKEWLDKRFESYKMTFTERHRIVRLDLAGYMEGH